MTLQDASSSDDNRQRKIDKEIEENFVSSDWNNLFLT